MIMFCKNCGNKLNKDEKFCRKCGNKVELNNTRLIDYENKKNSILSIISFILFVLSLYPYISFFEIWALSPAVAGYAIVILLFPAILLIVSSVYLSIKSIKKFSKGKKLGVHFKKSRVVFNYIDKIQLIISILAFILIIPMFFIAGNIPNTTVKKELTKIYSDNYEIVDESRCANAGGDNEYTTIIKLKDKNIYSLFHYDINTKRFYDTTNGILKGKYISLDNYFKKEYVSLVFINDIGYEEEQIEDVKILVLVNYNDYSLDELALAIKTLQDSFDLKYEDFELNVYVTGNIDKSKLDDYNLYLTAELASCSHGFETAYNKNLEIESVYLWRYDDLNGIKQEILDLLD